uniref:Uncharacterized protein n=1 Tax=Oryza nivara TaxID=4536 RepID=A0A0E0J183_ORYNI
MVGHRISRSHAGVNLRAAERDGRRLRGVLPVYHYQKNITVEDYAKSVVSNKPEGNFFLALQRLIQPCNFRLHSEVQGCNQERKAAWSLFYCKYDPA